MRNSHQNQRRRPVQARSQLSVEAIFVAATQILEQEGDDALTTNRVAERAGVSIGTLYQYFSNKEAILLALAEAGRRAVMDELDALMTELEAREDIREQDPREIFRRFVRAQVDGLAGGGFRRKLLHQCWRIERPADTALAIRETAERLTIALQRIGHPQLRSPQPALMFVLSRAMVGVVRSASLEKSPLLGGQELEDELVQLAWGLLARTP